jgi:hypothetical protein
LNIKWNFRRSEGGKGNKPIDERDEYCGVPQETDWGSAMKARFLILVFIGLNIMLPSIRAEDNRWEHFFTNSTGDRFYYDASSISKLPHSIVRVRVKGLSARQNVIVKEFEQVIEVNCENMIYRKLEAQTVRADGTVLADTEAPIWNSIESGSYTESLSEKVCKMTSRRYER